MLGYHRNFLSFHRVPWSPLQNHWPFHHLQNVVLLFVCMICMRRAPAINFLLASRAFKQDINMLPVQIVCDHILSNLYRFHYMCPQQMYFQQCVSRYCKSGQPHHMPLPVVAAFPGILNIFPATNICKVFATNICQKSSFAPKFAPNVKRKWKVSYGRPRICHASQNTRM